MQCPRFLARPELLSGQPRFCYVIAYGLHNVSQYFKNVVIALIFSLYSCIAMLKDLKFLRQGLILHILRIIV